MRNAIRQRQKRTLQARAFPFLFMALFSLLPVSAIRSAVAETSNYKVLGAKRIALKLAEVDGAIASVTIVNLEPSKGKPPWTTASMECSKFKAPGADGWLDCVVKNNSVVPSGASAALETSHSYVLVYNETAPGSPGKPPSPSKQKTLIVSTAPEVAVTQFEGQGIKGYLIYKFTSNVAFAAKTDPQLRPLQAASCGAQNLLWNKKQDIGEMSIEYSEPEPNRAIDDLEFVGVVCARIPAHLYFHELAMTEKEAKSFWNDTNETNVLADQLAFAGEAKFALPTPPAKKDDARFFATFTVAAGTGVHGAWGLDGKIAEFPRSFNAFNIRDHSLRVIPISATASVGSNTSNIKSQSYTNTINWTLPVQWTPSSAGSWAVIVTAGPKYETDIGFDKKNLLGFFDLELVNANLYQTLEVRTAHNKLIHKDEKTYDPKKLLAHYGFVFEPHLGIEGGAALIDTTQKATSGKATQLVPAYSIIRAVPQFRGVYQQSLGSLGLLTFDSTLTARYLSASENIVEQSKTYALRLKSIDGWKAINCLSGTWTPPKAGNVGITVTYNDGFAAPAFNRTNGVLIGVSIQY